MPNICNISNKKYNNLNYYTKTDSMKNYNQDINTDYPAKYFIALKSTDHEVWKKRWNIMKWEIKQNYYHMKFDDFALSNFEDKGNLFRLEQNNLHKASKEEILNSKIWIFPGALSTSAPMLKNTLSNFHEFFSNCEYTKDNTDMLQKSLIICPYSTGKERFKHAMNFGLKPKTYFSSAIQKLTEKYFIPRMISGRKTVLISHSVGGREISMIENCAYDILKNKYDYNNDQIKEFFSIFECICFGHATDISALADIRFKRITVLSASDQGVLIPPSLYQTIYKPKICIRPFSIFSIDEYEYIIFFGHQSSLELFNGKLNRDGHRFLHYMFQLYENLPDSILSIVI